VQAEGFPESSTQVLSIKWIDGKYKFVCDGADGKEYQCPVIFLFPNDFVIFQLDKDAQDPRVLVTLDGKKDWGAGKEPKVFENDVREFWIYKGKPETQRVAADAKWEKEKKCVDRKKTLFVVPKNGCDSPGPGVIVCPPDKPLCNN